MKKILLSILSVMAIAFASHAEESTVTFDFAAHYGEASVSNIQDLDPMVVDGFTLTFGKGNGSSGVTYNKEGNVRLNGSSTSKLEVDGNTVTIAAPAGKVITGIVLNPGTNYNYYSVLVPDQGNITSQGSNVAAYWDGYAETVVLTACRNKYVPSQATTSRYASAVVSYVSAEEALLKVSQYALNGEAVDTFKGLNLTFNKDIQVVSALFGGGQTVIKNAAGETMGTCFLTANGKNITVEYTDALTVGEYSLVLPANTIKTADASIVLPETAIKFSLRAAKLEGSLRFISSPIQASTSSIKIEWASDEWANNTHEYLVTHDGTEPTVDNRANVGKAKTRSIMLSTAKADSIFTFKVRAMDANGVLSEVYTQNVYAHYDASLDFYRAVTTMEAGNYVMMTPNTIAHPFTDDSKTYGYLPSADVANANNIANAFGFFEWTFETAEGGYYIKDSKGRYIYMTGNYNNFNISETVPTEGGVWTVTVNADSTAKVLNVAKEKYIQFSAEYGTWGSYSDARGTMPMLGKIATPEVVMTPNLDGTTITTNINEITFYCADGIEGGKNINSTSNYMRDNKTYDKYTFTVETVDANTVKFVFEQPLPTADYTFNLKKETFTAAPGSFNMIWPAADKSYKFSIVNPYEVTVTPSNEDRVEKLDTITFSNDLGIEVDNLFEGEAPFLSYKNGEEVVKVKLVATTNVTKTSIAFVPETAITAETTYTLEVAEGYFLIGEEQEANPAIKMEYSLVYPVVIVSSTPAEGGKVEKFSEITIEFNKEVVIEEPSSSYKYVLIDAQGNETEMKLERIEPKEVAITSYGYTSTYTVCKKARFYVDEPVAAEGAYKVQLGNYGWEIFDPINSVYLPAKAAINFEIKVEKLDIVSTSIAEGAELEQFTEMIVNFNKPVYHFDKTATVKNPEGQTVATLSLEMLEVVGEHKPLFGAAAPLAQKARLYASEPLTTDGTYYVNIPADMFATDDNSEYTTLTKVNFTVKAPVVEPEITATWSIAEGAELKSFESVDITFSGVESAKAKGTYSCFYFWEKNANGEWQHVENGCTAGYMDTEADGATVTFSADPGCYGEDFVSPFNRNGEYRIIIPAGDIFFNGDRTNVSTVDYVLNFTIKGDPAPAEIDAAFTADPANNSSISALEKVVLTFTDYTSIEVAELDLVMGTNIPYVYLIDELTGQGMPAGYIFFRAGAAANQLELYVDPDFNGGASSYNMAGSYMIRIPKKVVKFNDGVSKEIVLNYTVTGDEPKKELYVTASDPAHNATVNKLESIVVDWSMAITTPNGDDQIEAYIENVHGITVSTLRVVWAGLAGNQVRYVLNTPVTENGIYNLIIPEGDMVDFDTESIKSTETTLTFTVDAPQTGAPVMVSSDPESGATVDAIENITIVFNKPVVYDNYFEKATLQDKNGKVIATANTASYKDGDEENGATTLTFNLDSKVAEANAYIFVVPAKTIIDCYDWMTMMEKDINIELYIGGSGVEDITIVGSTPSANSTVETLSEITVEFNTGAAVLYMPEVVAEDGTVVSTTYMDLYDAEGNLLPDQFTRIILNTPVTEQSTVYLVFKAGSVYDYPNYQVSNSQDLRVKFEVSGQGGINGVEADPENGYVVYDLNGFRVMQTKKASDLNRLNNGLYIINGVKVLINK